MKSEYVTLIGAIALGLILWAVDGCVDYYFFETTDTLGQALLTGGGFHDLYMRSLVLACFTLLGAATARLQIARRRDRGLSIEQGKRLALFLDSIQEGIVAVGPDERIRYLNATAEKLCGWPNDEACGLEPPRVLSLADPETKRPFEYRVVLDDPVWKKSPILILAKDGTPTLVRAHMTSMPCAADHPTGTLISLYKISVPAGTSPQEFPELSTLQHFFNVAGPIIVALDTDARVTLINQPGAHVFGQSRHELSGRHWGEWIYGEADRESFRSIFTSIIQETGAATQSAEFRVTAHDGTPRPYHWSCSLTKATDGHVTGVYLVGTDASTKHAEHAALANDLERYRTLIESATDLMFVKERNFIITLANTSTAELLDSPVDEVVGKTEEDIFGVSGGGRDLIREVDIRVLDGETIEEEVTRPIRGKGVTLHVVKSPLRTADGNITGVYVIARNITNRKRSTDSLRESEARLMRQNAAMVKLDMRKLLSSASLTTAVRKITEVAAETLDVERMSVWLLNDDSSVLRCIDLYQRVTDHHASGTELSNKQYPRYFDALEQERIIAAHNAHTDSRTSEYSDTYLAPLGISSMLDAPIRAGGRIAGVICCEQVGPARRWTLDEENFAASLADSVGLAMEVTERSRAQDALAQQEHLLSMVVQTTQDAMISIGADGLITLFNPAAEQMFGRTAEQMIGQPLDLLMPEEYRERHSEYVRSYFDTGSLHGAIGKVLELPAIRADGSHFTMEISLSESAQQDQRFVIAIARDISARRQAEMQLRESEERYRDLIERAADGIVVVQDFRVVYANPKIAEILGFAVEEVLDRSIEDFLNPEERDRLKDRYERRLAGEEVPQIYRTTLRHCAGHFVNVELNARAIKYGGDDADCVFVRELAERQRDDQLLTLTRFAIERALDSAFLIDKSGNILYANEMASRILGYSQEELRSITIPDIDATIGPADWEGRFADIRQPKDVTFPTTMHPKVGPDFPVEVNLTHFSLEDEEFCCAFVRDLRHDHGGETPEAIPSRAFSILDVCQDPICIVDDSHHITYANAAFHHEFGGWHTRRCFELFDNRDTVCPWCRAEDRFTSPKTDSHWTAGHTGQTYHLTRTPVRLENNKAGIILLLRNVTQNQHKDHQLQAAHNALNQVFHESLDVLLVIGEDGRVLKASESVATLLGYRPEKLVGKPIKELLIATPDPSHEEALAKLRVYGGIFEGLEFKHRDGTPQIADITATVINWDGAKAILAVLRDSGEREQTITNLRTSEKKYRTLYSSMREGVLLCDVEYDEHRRPTDYCLNDLNPAAERILGGGRNELIGKPASELFNQQPPPFLKPYSCISPISGSITFEEDIPSLNHVFRVSLIAMEHGKFAAILDDITEHRGLAEQIRILGQFPEGNPSPVLRVNRDGKILYANEQGLSVRSTLSAGTGDYVPQEIKEVIAVALSEKRNRETEITVDGITWLVFIRPIPQTNEANVYCIDITDRRQVERDLRDREEQLRHAQKMEAVGRLASGVAHDFNNLLSVIAGHCEILALKFPPDDPAFKSISEINKASEHGSSLTRQLLAFSRKQPQELHFINVNDVVTDIEAMLRRIIGSDIELATITEPNLKLVKADPGQLEQVLMNLVVNARDAMPAGGQISIETDNVTLDEPVAQELGLSAGDYIQLAVSDTGLGMDEETMSQLFEPFFTTKEAGKGTGLGLSTVYGIVTQTGGQVTAESEPKVGTTFRIYLPRVVDGQELPEETDIETAPIDIKSEQTDE